MLQGDATLAVTRNSVGNDGGKVVRLVANMRPNNCAPGNAECEKQGILKAQALATMLAPFGNATLSDAKVGGRAGGAVCARGCAGAQPSPRGRKGCWRTCPLRNHPSSSSAEPLFPAARPCSPQVATIVQYGGQPVAAAAFPTASAQAFELLKTALTGNSYFVKVRPARLLPFILQPCLRRAISQPASHGWPCASRWQLSARLSPHPETPPPTPTPLCCAGRPGPAAL